MSTIFLSYLPFLFIFHATSRSSFSYIFCILSLLAIGQSIRRLTLKPLNIGLDKFSKVYIISIVTIHRLYIETWNVTIYSSMETMEKLNLEILDWRQLWSNLLFKVLLVVIWLRLTVLSPSKLIVNPSCHSLCFLFIRYPWIYGAWAIWWRI